MEILAQSSTAFVLTHNFQGTHILGASRGRLSDSVASCLRCFENTKKAYVTFYVFEMFLTFSRTLNVTCLKRSCCLAFSTTYQSGDSVDLRIAFTALTAAKCIRLPSMTHHQTYYGYYPANSYTTREREAKVEADTALRGNPISELRDVTYHMGSRSVTCHPTQVNAPRLTPVMQAGTRFTYPGGMEG